MWQKIKTLWTKRREKHNDTEVVQNTYTREQLENAYKLGYNDGKRDGLAIARVQATKSLKEILWQQNHHPTKK